MKGSDIKVSVIIPVYNTEKYLRQCLDSVVNQTLKEIEIICVDDGSTDSSLEILREYERKDSRVRVLTEENKNAGAARNYGLSLATGKYLSFLDADDFFELDMLEKAYNHAQEHQAQIVVFASDRFNQELKKFEPMGWSIHKDIIPSKQVFSGREIEKNRFQAFIGWAWDKLFEREFIEKEQLYFQEQRTTNDMYFVFSAVVKAERIHVFDDVLAHYRRETNASLSVTREKSWHCFYDALCKVRAQMQGWGYWDWIERDFVNYAVHAILWNLNTLAESTQRLLYQKLKTEWLFDLGILDKSESYFYSVTDYHKLIKIMAVSYNEYFGKVEYKTIENVQNDLCTTPKVSVVMPSLNVAQYIRECIESVMDQTLRDIEIICVDAGSTDGTLEILQEYAQLDPRIRIINSDKKSYGYQMNLGLKAARGEYLGIVETDDFADLHMFETLYKKAKENDAEVVKSNYHKYKSKTGISDEYYEILKGLPYNKIIKPQDNTRLFDLAACIWSGIYKKEFLIKNNIDFVESPGASYQDTAFILKVWSCATRVLLVSAAFLHYRIDNDNSSVKSRGKVYCVCDEFESVHMFLEQRPEKKKLFQNVIWARQSEVYRWNYFRLFDEFRLEFIERMKSDFEDAYYAGEFDRTYFTPSNWNMLVQVLKNPEIFYKNNRGDNGAEPREKKVEIIPYIKHSRKKDTPKVSVIIPVYNVELYLNECLDSIINQTLTEIEIICVNDGSTDRSLSILENYYANDERITIINQQNGGQSAARNRGIDEAHGKYVYFMDSDDILDVNALKVLYDTCEKKKLDLILFDFERFFDGIEMTEGGPTANKRKKEYTHIYDGVSLLKHLKDNKDYITSACFMMVSRETLIKNAVRFYEGIIHEDELYCFEIMMCAERASHIGKKFYQRRVRPNSTMTNSKSSKTVIGYFSVMQQMLKYGLDPNLDQLQMEETWRAFLGMKASAQNSYKLISPDERRKIQFDSSFSKLLFNTMIVDEVQQKTNFSPAYRGKVEQLEREIKDIHSSWTYRIGRFMTFIPRKVRGGIRCYQENGWSYTWNRILVHLHIKKS